MYYPKVLVVGSGGVGVMAALGLALNKRSIVTLVVRSGYDYVAENGYAILSITYGDIKGWKPHYIAKSVHEAADKHGPFDFIVLTTKNIPDSESPCEKIIEPAVTDGQTTIVLIQNGIGIEVPMTQKFPNNIILSGVSLINSINKNYHIVNLLKDRLFLGAFHSPNVDEQVKRAAIEKFMYLYQNDNNKNEVIPDSNVQKTRWEKLLYNSIFNTTTTIVNMDVTRCQINNGNRELFEPAMDELIAVAKSDGIDVDPGIKEKYLHISDGSFYSPSMMLDARKRQLLELEVIMGNPLRIAKNNNISTPILSTLYSLLKMLQFQIKEEIGIISIDESLYRGNSEDYPTIFSRNSK